MAEPTDIEVYVRSIKPDAAVEWLQHLAWEIVETKTFGRNVKIEARINNTTIPILAVPSDKKFTSIWFQSIHTPWDSDLACAREAMAYFQTEVRASQGGWQEETEDERWWKINKEGEQLVDWS